MRSTLLLIIGFVGANCKEALKRNVNISSDFSSDVTYQAGLSTPELILYWGYPVQTYDVVTEDGYILQLHRIPYGRNAQPADKKPVVFLQHGLEASSNNWVSNLPHQSAAFIFADQGFDVWMGNMRGNRYSKRHVRLHPMKKDFWRFSFDQMAKYDLDAMINAVLNETGHESLYYVGHSQGTLTMFSKLSMDPNFNKKIKKFFALAPVGTVKHIGGILKFIAHTFYDLVRIGSKFVGNGEFLPNSWLYRTFTQLICGDKLGNVLCDNFLFLITGPDSHQINVTRTPVYAAQVPAGTSVQNIIHWAQLVRTGALKQYDFANLKENIQHYGSKTPPAYNLKQTNAPVYLFWSDFDWLADKKDIEEFLIPNLRKDYLVENIQIPKYNHMDFVFGVNASQDVYYPILNRIRLDLGKQPIEFNNYVF
ncbi:unnamed protein product [Bursaphelenchus xylophilus]|uniref:Lipase n=1 Tax=Bursaphelenchus xylophilus TaxID=6326 RepID=A0A1I7SAP4_BURXY|nr:unnamed protein product [Bursaphelenchus xylophilus]CAG9126920.1 unnamed protein product [Bursaphelenchus xylophilus]